jgi:hypothetical protein
MVRVDPVSRAGSRAPTMTAIRATTMPNENTSATPGYPGGGGHDRPGHSCAEGLTEHVRAIAQATTPSAGGADGRSATHITPRPMATRHSPGRTRRRGPYRAMQRACTHDPPVRAPEALTWLAARAA